VLSVLATPTSHQINSHYLAPTAAAPPIARTCITHITWCRQLLPHPLTLSSISKLPLHFLISLCCVRVYMMSECVCVSVCYLQSATLAAKQWRTNPQSIQKNSYKTCGLTEGEIEGEGGLRMGRCFEHKATLWLAFATIVQRCIQSTNFLKRSYKTRSSSSSCELTTTDKVRATL